MAVKADKRELFEHMPIPKALAAMAIPTIISQLINLIYNMVDAFFIGRTGDSYMMAAISLTLTMVMMAVAFSNLFGVGGGSLIARLNGAKRYEDVKTVSAFSFYGAVCIACAYSLLMWVFLNPILRFLGASDATITYAKQYTILVVILGNLPNILGATLAHLLRNSGYSKQASLGLSTGNVLNIILDPLFMFVLLPDGYEVVGAALATLLANMCACIYLLCAYRKATQTTSLSMKWEDARGMTRENRKDLFKVGVPSAVLTGLYDLANITVNILASLHSDLVVAAMGIVLKIERVPNAINIGICQGMLPIVAYNYSSGNRERMKKTLQTARVWGILVSLSSIVLIHLCAGWVTGFFLKTTEQNMETALITIGFAAMFLRIRCLSSPMQLINYHTSCCMQSVGDGAGTMLHAIVRELVCYIPIMILMDYLWGETGLAAALAVGEACSAAFALWMLQRSLKKAEKNR